MVVAFGPTVRMNACPLSLPYYRLPFHWFPVASSDTLCVRTLCVACIVVSVYVGLDRSLTVNPSSFHQHIYYFTLTQRRNFLNLHPYQFNLTFAAYQYAFNTLLQSICSFLGLHSQSRVHRRSKSLRRRLQPSASRRSTRRPSFPRLTSSPRPTAPQPRRGCLKPTTSWTESP